MADRTETTEFNVKPCPFCGGAANMTVMPKPTIDEPHIIWCLCGASMSDTDEEICERKWNARHV